ncbi:NBR1-Ig-like domain-containing protein [Luteimonas sp. SX5]|uniref:NBR1-Ig-like domain-containing protein n=1 Tax=Luteimonas galliterrae TaxID=2940486 RepID=A0ABT0MK14_9GAMM|nr:RHS repeat-associated core domain-containing protein [Luteimonas galliterrae]MCL1635018.1 NBR1-Ig-like domain-containing protein [Luteimonas galliterrae]
MDFTARQPALVARLRYLVFPLICLPAMTWPLAANALRTICEESTGNCSASGPEGNCTVTGGRCWQELDSGDYEFLSHSGREPKIWDSNFGNGSGGPRSSSQVSRNVQVQNVKEPCETTAKPVVIATGNKILTELDFLVPPDAMPLVVNRFYDKSLDRLGIFGKKWSSTLEYTLSFDYGGSQCHGRLDTVVSCAASGQPLTKIFANRTNGFATVFTKDTSGLWRDGGGRIIVPNGSGWKLTTKGGEQQTYDAHGRPLTIKNERNIGLTYGYNASNQLSTVTHTSGRAIQLTWSGSKVASIIAPNTKTYAYSYNAAGYLASVIYPDNLGVRTYHYEDSAQPGGLTGISINSVRYSRYAYGTDGRAAWSGLENNVEKSTFTYGAGYTDVRNALGQTTRYLTADFSGSKRVIAVDRPASPTCLAGGTDTTYDVNGNPDDETDAYGVKTDYTYNADGNITQKIVGIGPAGETGQQQITQFVWDPSQNNRLLSIKTIGNTSQPVNETSYDYYPDGDARARLLKSVSVKNLMTSVGLTNSVQATAYAYTLHPSGMVATMTVDGPIAGSGDAIVYTYDTAGNLLEQRQVIDAKTIKTVYAGYNELGQPGQITNPNSGSVYYTYNARGQVLTEKLYVNGAWQTTTNTYDNRGRLQTRKAPDDVVTNYEYDNYDRLINIFRVEPESVLASMQTLTGASSSVGFVGGFDGLTAGGDISGTGEMGPMSCHPQPDCELDPDPPTPPANAASFVDQTVPATMVAGQTYPVTIRMTNTGTATWTTANNYKLGSANPLDNTTWGLHRDELTTSIAPQQTATFSFNVTAPSTAGAYNFQWRMVRDGVAWFGVFTPNVQIAVQAAPTDGATFVSQSVPASMTTGKTYPVTVTMKNTGTTTWTTANNYKLGSVNNVATWGTTRAALPSTIAPGVTATFNFNVTAPATVGMHNFQWRMLREGVAWIGPNTTNVAVGVNAPPPPPIGFQRFTYNLASQITKIETGVEYTPESSGQATDTNAVAVDDGTMHPNICYPYPDCIPDPPDPGPTAPPREEVILTSTFIDYDEGGFVKARRGNNGQNIRYQYNQNGDLVKVTDSLNYETTYAHDRHRRVVRIIDAKTGNTFMSYDALGNVKTVADPKGSVTTYSYDGLGQLWSQISPDTGITTFAYNADGQRTSMTRADGAQTTYGYDALGRPTTITAGGLVHSFVYDTCSYGLGLLCRVVDPKGTLDYAYTPHGWLASQKQAVGSSVGWDQTFTYDGLGRVTSVAYPNSVSVGYSYAYGRLDKMTTTFGGSTKTVVSNLTYRPFGPVTGLTYGNGLQRNYNADTDGRIKGISTLNGATPIQSLTFGYDANDNIKAITNAINASLTQTFNYDQLSRLTSVSATNATQSFQYDANGNRSSHTWGGATDTYGVPLDSNQLNGITGPRAKLISVDDNGNITVAGDASYVYNPFNRLTQATRGGVTTTYWVNALGQRTYKTQGAPKANGYGYSPDGSLVMEYDWNGLGWTHYLRLGSEPIALVRGSQLYYLHNDQLGRPEIATNSAKSVVWRASNYAFDRTVTQDSIGGLNLGFPGQHYDAETGNWYNGFRDYDTRLGRYLQSDPIGLAGGMNTYAYVDSNPIIGIDPFGLFDPRNAQGMVNQARASEATAVARFYGSPDFINISVSYLHFSGTYSLTKYGKSFLGISLSKNLIPSGKNPFKSPSASINVGYVCETESNKLQTEEDINETLRGAGSTISGYYGVGGGTSVSYPSGSKTVFGGVGVGARGDLTVSGFDYNFEW